MRKFMKKFWAGTLSVVLPTLFVALVVTVSVLSFSLLSGTSSFEEPKRVGKTTMAPPYSFEELKNVEEPIRSVAVAVTDPCASADGTVEIRKEDFLEEYRYKAADGKERNLRNIMRFQYTDYERETRCVLHRFFVHDTQSGRPPIYLLFFNENDPDYRVILNGGEGDLVFRSSLEASPASRMINRTTCLSELSGVRWRDFIGLCYVVAAETAQFGELYRNQEGKGRVWSGAGFKPVFWIDHITEFAAWSGRNLVTKDVDGFL